MAGSSRGKYLGRLGRAPDTAAPEVDPMDELGDFNEPALQNNKKGKGNKYSFVSQVVRLTMPVWPPEALTGGQAPIPRTVSVIIRRGEWHALAPFR